MRTLRCFWKSFVKISITQLKRLLISLVASSTEYISQSKIIFKHWHDHETLIKRVCTVRLQIVHTVVFCNAIRKGKDNFFVHPEVTISFPLAIEIDLSIYKVAVRGSRGVSQLPCSRT